MGIIYWVCSFLSHITHKKLAYKISEFTGIFMYFSFYSHNRKNVISNISHISTDGKKLVLPIYKNFARFVYEFLLLPRINKNNLSDFLEVKNKEVLDSTINDRNQRTDAKIEAGSEPRQSLVRGKARNEMLHDNSVYVRRNGVIVLTAHLGNWELGAAMLAILGYNPTVIALPQRSRLVRNFFTRKRILSGMDVVYTDEKMTKVLKKLRNGGVVATLGDKVYGGEKIYENFFNKPCAFPNGIFRIAEITGAKIIPAFCVMENNKYKVYFEEPLKNGIKEWVSIVEKYVKKYPTQWFVFKPLWQK